MSPVEEDTRPLLPRPNESSAPARKKSHTLKETRNLLVGWLLFILLIRALRSLSWHASAPMESFFWTKNQVSDLCYGYWGNASSYSGYIGLKGDSEQSPKRSFYWLFESQDEAEDAPVVLTIGGGPGSSGLLNPMLGQSHCTITSNGSTLPNPNAWTERYNILDHPIGVGFSYGTTVNNSRDAAIDVYDFLQKFFSLYPRLASNKFILAGGSYGGTYVPHIATVINERNKVLAKGHAEPGAIHINLEAMMVSNPYSDTLTHYRWMLQQRCYNTNFYNTTTCMHLYSLLPSCLESIQFALETTSTEVRRNATQGNCGVISEWDHNGISLENIKVKCNGTLEDCVPEIVWATTFLSNPDTTKMLGVPETIAFAPFSMDVNYGFFNAGDLVQQPYLLYEDLLNDGIRLLHYVGKLDCNCAWPGVLSFLKLLHSPFQTAFLQAPDIPWPTEDVATVRAIGEGAGNMTFVLMTEAGHFVTRDQPALVKNIVEHWVDNKPFR